MSARQLIREALRLLGKRRLVLSIHDGSFPARAEEEIGRGTPYSRGGRAFLGFVAGLGFDGIQFGPQGQTDRGNPSPYDGTVFSRNVLSISIAALREESPWGSLIDPDGPAAAARAIAGRDRDRVRYEQAFDVQKRLLSRLYERYELLRESCAAARELAEEVAGFGRRQAAWLESDALFEALAEEHGTGDWTRWPDRRPKARHARTIERYKLEQFLAHHQHEVLHREAGRLGLALFADMQIGLSARDAWALQSLFLNGYRLGAPPSRTNRFGQPWGYPVFDPDAFEPSVRRHLRLRADKLFAEFDGLRIDHPQGLVCPWVYRSDDPDPLRAVQNGARLFESPALPGHPELARYARVRPEQLGAGPAARRHDDDWVRGLDPPQVEQYAMLMAVIVDAATRHGRDRRDIACEILSTLPYPLARVIRHYGLGRFRVTQKMSLADPADVYRSENAEPEDWIMMGNHDTPPIWRVVEDWRGQGEIEDRAAYLADRLAPGPDRSALRSWLSSSAGRLVHGQMADALLSRAENVLVFFADLFGQREIYNDPGTVGPQNWSLRVPHDYRRSWRGRISRLEALNLPYALALALDSRRSGLPASRHSLIERLYRAAGVPAPALQPLRRPQGGGGGGQPGIEPAPALP